MTGRYFAAGLALTGVVALSAVPAGAEAPERLLWEGRSNGMTLRWTSADLTAEVQGRKVSLFRPRAQKGFQEFSSDLEPSPPPESVYERSFTVLSVVGPYVSFEDDVYANAGGAHPAVERSFTTVRVVPTPADVSLTDLFPEADVLKALLADPLIQKALKAANIRPPTSLAGLPELLQGTGLQPPGDPCSYSLPPDFLTHFAFHHVQGGQVAVRLALPPSAGACRTQLAQLGLLLPIPPGLAPLLAAAASGKEGFLMGSRKPVSPGKGAGASGTTISFKPGKGASAK